MAADTCGRWCSVSTEWGRGGRRAVAFMVVLGVLLAGCTTSRVGSSSGSVHVASWFETGSLLCRSVPGPALAAGMKRSVARTVQVPTYPLAFNADESRLFVSTYGRDFSGVAELEVASGKLHPIHAFAHPHRYQASGAFDGRYLVWFEYHSLYGLDDFTAYSYDTQTGLIRVIGNSHIDPQGYFYSSPWRGPVASAGYAAFTVGVGAGGLNEVLGVELATGANRVLRLGHAWAPMMFGTTVIWPESAAPGVETTLRAVDVRTGRSLELSKVFRAVHGPSVLAGDGNRFAYGDPTRHELFYSPTPSTPAKVVLRLPHEEQFQELWTATHTLVWTTTEATYVADTRTGRYARLVTNGSATVSAGAVAIMEPPAVKAIHPVNAEHLLRIADIEIQPCPVPAR